MNKQQADAALVELEEMQEVVYYRCIFACSEYGQYPTKDGAEAKLKGLLSKSLGIAGYVQSVTTLDELCEDNDGAKDELEKAIAVAKFYKEQSEWRDIESALNIDNHEITSYNGVMVQNASYWEGYWIDQYHDYINPQPTHYKPLPQPPKEKTYGAE